MKHKVLFGVAGLLIALAKDEAVALAIVLAVAVYASVLAVNAVLRAQERRHEDAES